MKMDVLTTLHADDGDGGRELGAIVVRAHPVGGAMIEVGAADGPPVVRFQFSAAEAQRIGAALQQVAGGGGESVLLDGE
ncbi:MAG: hypothetical protein ACR2J8_05305 [Thermomicrobiales bacterium]